MNNLIIAAAGSGKTEYIINKAIDSREESVLITTFTQQNYKEICRRIIEKKGVIPNHISVQTWFSFLIQHGVKPYQNYLYKGRISGLNFVNKKSGIRYFNKKRGFPVYYKQNNYQHYLSKSGKIYSDKLSKFVIKANEKSNGKVIERISDIYSLVFIDEAQDLAGYDLSILRKLFNATIDTHLVCDPRQTTYQTHLGSKFKKYRGGKLKEFIEDECTNSEVEINETELAKSYRNNSAICNLSSKLFPEYVASESLNNHLTGHDGIFRVKEFEVFKYLDKYNPVQLRWSSKDKRVNENYRVYNFGESKGLGFDRVLLFPTSDMSKWFHDNSTRLEDTTRAKLYVALTRARYSVGIVE